MEARRYREIPFNYTSADDQLIVSWLLGEQAWEAMEHLRGQRVTGRSARLLLRFVGDLFAARRNPFLYQELLDSPRRREAFLRAAGGDLRVVERNCQENPEVLALTARCREVFLALQSELQTAPVRRQQIRAILGAVVGPNNVCFDPFHLVAHATDATDWRMYLPLAVVYPWEEEQVAPLLKAISGLGLKAIPRGAGTGLTGGAVPLAADCVMVNTERLNRIRKICEEELDSGLRAGVLEAEAGVVTEDAIHAAAAAGWVFATDPTSAWACTLGGNIAENAGGKMAVLWGTAVDNLLEWRMALADGRRIAIRRLGHPGRKIQPDDGLQFEVSGADGAAAQTIRLQGAELRKRGLWKDITNKALGGLPGLQKEGTDGVITSARFILHRPYPFKATACLEFFGADMQEACQVILELTRALPDRGEETLQALEHFDEEYVQAIGYRVKAGRPERPKAVLLVDLVARGQAQLERGVEALRAILGRHANTELFLARDAAQAQEFWADRKRLGAIARRTNAFKLNEDVVLPLPRLADFAAFVERLNLEEERHNHLALAGRLQALLQGHLPGEEDAHFPARLSQALPLFERTAAEVGAASKHTLREGQLVKAWLAALKEWFEGWPQLCARLEEAAAEERGRLIVVATHMHAGDGNIHVNIPVFSNDREMLQRAHATAEEAMRQAVAMGGVVSGEHGLGITKVRHLEPDRLEALRQHRARLDPGGVLNPGKLEDPKTLERAFTPSFNLLKLEARILQHDQLEVLARKIQACIRCGKCKPDCCVFDPRRALFYHPRNKNLAIGSLIEVLLYDAQRSQSTRFEALRRLEEVADHCTICHKCLKPCPVEIDTGEVSILEREILKGRGFKHTSLPTRAALYFLKRSRNRKVQAAFRMAALGLGVRAQRAAASLARVITASYRLRRVFPFSILARPLARPSFATMRGALPECGARQVLCFKPPGADPAQTVFYFPGCGSERIFGEVGQAALYLLLKAGFQVLLPPAGLCCGYPFGVNGRQEERQGIELRDAIILSQIREMFSHLRFSAVAFSCGTCLEALRALQAAQIFEAPLKDCAALALEAGLRHAPLGEALYHKPCHDSLQGHGLKVLRQAGALAQETAHCCGEAGTLALSRPDIGLSLQDRKEEGLREALQSRPACRLLLTNCPSCLQGLGRQEGLGLRVRHLAVELAEAAGGAGWREEFRRWGAEAQRVTF